MPAFLLNQWTLYAVGFVVLFGAWQIDKRLYASKKAAEAEVRVVTNIEKATTNATQKGKRAADRSRDASVRGPVDPTTRHD